MGFTLDCIKLKEVKLLTDEEIIVSEKNLLFESKKYHLKGKAKCEINKKKMELFLKNAKAYKPPTKDHDNIARFMIEQLEETMSFDCDTTYYINKLKNIKSELDNINVDNVRSEMKISATRNIAYHTKENENEVNRCKEHNKWYKEFIDSL